MSKTQERERQVRPTEREGGEGPLVEEGQGLRRMFGIRRGERGRKHQVSNRQAICRMQG